MKLLYAPNSPFARKIRIVLREKAMHCHELQISLNDVGLESHNPLGKVPTIIADDQTVMFDSVVIADYLELIQTDPRMIPVDLWERVIVKKWESLGDGLCDVLITTVLEQRRPIEKQEASVIARSDHKAITTLKHIDTEIAGRIFAFGNVFTLADAALLSAVGYVALRRPHLLDGFAAIRAYQEIHASRPSILATMPPG